MAVEKKEKGPEYWEELVEYTAPLDLTGETNDILVAVVPETIRIKRGETVQIKRKFLEALKNANAQAMEAFKVQNKFKTT